jgi:methylamine dehydrogenase accessory protein MauD
MSARCYPGFVRARVTGHAKALTVLEAALSFQVAKRWRCESLQGWWAVSYGLLWLLVIMLCVIVVALARQIGTLHLRLGPRGALEVDSEGPALGEAPPARTATTIDGREVTIGGPGRAQLLLFVSPGCLVCDEVLPALDAVARGQSLAPLVVADSSAGERQVEQTAAKTRAPVVTSEEAMTAYAVPGTPYVVALDDLGVVRAKATVNNMEQFEGLVETAAARSAAARAQQEAGK